MTVRFFAYLRNPEFASCKETSVQGVSTLRELGEKLGDLYGKRFREEFFSPDETKLGERVIVLVNGRKADFLAGLDTPLKETDVVSVFPVVAGG